MGNLLEYTRWNNCWSCYWLTFRHVVFKSDAKNEKGKHFSFQISSFFSTFFLSFFTIFILNFSWFLFSHFSQDPVNLHKKFITECYNRLEVNYVVSYIYWKEKWNGGKEKFSLRFQVEKPCLTWKINFGNSRFYPGLNTDHWCL